MAKNVATDQTRLLFITTARGNADTALPRGRRSVRRAIRLVHQKLICYVPDRSNRRITLRYRRKNCTLNSASSAGLSRVSMRVCRFEGFD